MSGVTLQTTIADSAARAYFTALATVMDDTTPVMRAIGVGLVEGTHTRFEHAVSPDGQPWAPLLPAYAAIKKGPGILRESAMRGGLMGSITFRAGRAEVEVGTNKIYAAVHQFGATIEPKNWPWLVFRLASGMVFVGSVTIPARPYIGISRDDEQMILETIIDALDRRTGSRPL
ncbi:phage virion morphogenesis protein [Xanthobacter autotrophicus]|uniref:phage virion morphogenesis protein n=1 Tax=Xanthobacter TaxID=279 RepID=UPI0024AA0E07|nr:phage virion morphogenesis protein [Xanthobacter autotrophicus]MDI4664706.1 phage virion morphogenesis protein [Xanthobacter autotrophicus]